MATQQLGEEIGATELTRAEASQRIEGRKAETGRHAGCR